MFYFMHVTGVIQEAKLLTFELCLTSVCVYRSAPELIGCTSMLVVD